MYERLTAIRRALAEAPTWAIADRLAEQVAKEYDVLDVELLLVDYRLGALVPLRGGEPHTHPGSPGWRSFDHQSELAADDALFLPVTARGDRLGVLRVAPAVVDRADVAELAEVAEMLAHELSAAWAKTDRYAAGARVRRLTLAAEMQWELLPGRSCVRPAFSLAGQLEPAYAVRGDGFDWSDDAGRLAVAVVNGMGEGVAAAMLTTLAISALRNARRAGLPLADQAALADQAVYAHHGGAAHVEALLLELDLRTGEVTIVDAGSPRLMLLRDGEVGEQRLEAQLPLGMFEDTIYQPQRMALRTGDRLLVLSDGVFDAASTSSRYGESALDRFVRRTRSLAPLEAVRSLLGDLRAFVGGELVDDAVVVCLDWAGPRG
ncbi:MAG TPA: PP2C family protein-serine/threonine phosphatase [Pilimelia sp.]|nr:PP2C family protein-serine/threonine phosphatase [Pilimelia sp.]